MTPRSNLTKHDYVYKVPIQSVHCNCEKAYCHRVEAIPTFGDMCSARCSSPSNPDGLRLAMTVLAMVNFFTVVIFLSLKRRMDRMTAQP